MRTETRSGRKDHVLHTDMSLRSSARAIKGFVVRPPHLEVRIIPKRAPGVYSAVILFLAAAATTLGIGFREPRVEYGYECIIFILAACWCLGGGVRSMPPIPGFALGAIGLWGFCQLAVDATVYRYATLESSLRFAALAATAWASFQVFGSRLRRVKFLRVFSMVRSRGCRYFGTGLLHVTRENLMDIQRSLSGRLGTVPQPKQLCAISGAGDARGIVVRVAWGFGKQTLPCVCRSDAGFGTRVGVACGRLHSGAGGGCHVMDASQVEERVGRITLGLVLATAVFGAMAGVGTLAGRLTAADPFQVRRGDHSFESLWRDDCEPAVRRDLD